MFTRTINEVCEEAIEYLDSAHERGQKISPWDIRGYFTEIQNLYKSGEDDLKQEDNMAVVKCETLETYRQSAMTTARELFYGEKVIKDIKAAKSEGEIIRIMRTARQRN